MIDAERKAFEHAAKLAKEYRHKYRYARSIAVIEGIVIAVMYCGLIWRCLHG